MGEWWIISDWLLVVLLVILIVLFVLAQKATYFSCLTWSIFFSLRGMDTLPLLIVHLVHLLF